MAFQFTPGQTRAIEARGSALLVSAAAGSGKTRVLTQRLINYVSDPVTPKNIDSFLIITYTRAAAVELRSRIIAELGKLTAEKPASAHLRRQQSLCCRAQIGTIHSFCADVLRENCHHLGIAPTFRVMEEDRAQPMRERVLEKLLEERYAGIEEDEEFRLLADTIGAGKDDGRLVDVVLRLHEKLRSHAYPEDWARTQIEQAEMDGVTDAGETVWGREILESVGSSARFWAERMEHAVQEIHAAGGKLEKAYGENYKTTAAALRDFVRALESGWDRARAFLPIPFDRLNPLRGFTDTAAVECLKTIRDDCKKAAKDWEKLLNDDSQQLIGDMQAMAGAGRALLTLTLDFDRAYSAEKRRQNELDFSDLEHYAAQLLVERESGAPTWIAYELSHRYTEIMVDEYQDVNAVQEMIFRAVSREGRNLFLVGDVKQSIYRFRLADLSIFLEKNRRYGDIDCAAESCEGRRVLLQENFRSRRSILDAANHVFSNIMSEELGELDYNEEAALKYGALGYPEGTDVPVELDVIDPPAGDDDAETPDAAAREAGFVAERILQMMRERTPVYENGVPRPCRWSDFAILMRSPSGKGADFHRTLAEAGIPVQSQQGGGFFSSLEVSLSINMLSVVDNPHADVPLISVLRSPAFLFTPDELSSIRACDRKGDYYSALCACANSGNEKCRAFLTRLEALRTAAPDLSVGELLWRIYDETALFALCTAMQNGDTRRRNLMELFELAGRFERTGASGAFRFIAWLQRMAERGDEPSVGGEGDAVHIMSIHKSKGLEFPFVFLSDLTHGFNRKDLSAAVLMHTELGLGLKVTDTERGVEYPTLARRAIEQRLQREMLSEEMRVLYVGMTRAKERLFMTCVWKNAAKKMDELRPSLMAPMPAELLRTASNMGRWVISAALLEGAPMEIKLHTTTPAAECTPTAAASSAPETEENYEILRAALDFRYPRAAAADLPSKLTATGIKGRTDDAERMLESETLVKEAHRDEFSAPVFGGETSNAAAKGTAVHALLQHLDLSDAGSTAAVKRQIKRLVASGHLTAEQAETIDAEPIVRFGTGALCRRMREAEELFREFRFTLLVDASEYYDVPPGDQLLLQGVIDCYFVEQGGITVVDYKTDRVAKGEASAHAARYALQLKTYASAISRIRGLPVRQCVVYFLHTGEWAEIEIS